MKKLVSDASTTQLKTEIFEEISLLNSLVTNGYFTDEQFITQLQHFKMRIEKIFEQFERKSDANPIMNGLNSRQMKLLEYLAEYGSINRREYTIMFEVSPMTAYRDLNLLKEKKLLIEIGNGRGTQYIIKK